VRTLAIEIGVEAIETLLLTARVGGPG